MCLPVRGTGVVELQLKVQMAAYDASAKAFWSVWRATGEIQIGGLPGGRPPLAQIGEGYATQQHGEINTGGRGRVESGLAHETKTHFAFRVDTACTRPRGIEKCWHVGAKWQPN